MGEVEEQWRSTAAPVIFLIVVAFQFGYKYLDDLRKEASKSPKEVELRAEIKRLLSEASTLSQPSTFAQAAKLRRVAAAKEKELSKYQEVRTKEVNLSFDLYLKVTFLGKVLTYLILVCWFWRTPVSTVSQQLVQPFGKLLSWKAGGHSSSDVMVGIIPWLIVCTRVSRFISRFVN